MFLGVDHAFMLWSIVDLCAIRHQMANRVTKCYLQQFSCNCSTFRTSHLPSHWPCVRAAPVDTCSPDVWPSLKRLMSAGVILSIVRIVLIVPSLCLHATVFINLIHVDVFQFVILLSIVQKQIIPLTIDRQLKVDLIIIQRLRV